MKKFLSIAMVAVMLLATLSVVALAGAPKAAEYQVNNGYLIDGVNAPAKIADTATGLQIINGGYYVSGDNCGGVVSIDKYDLNGFEAVIYFEKVPEVDTSTNCWVATDFLAAPRGFHTANFNVENGGNQGIMNLIRFGKPFFEAYDGIKSFAQIYNSQKLDATINNIFYITSGTTLTVKLNRTETDLYALTYSREGFEDFTYVYDVASVFPDGKAHFSVITCCGDTPADAWTYYITDIKNGVEKTDEDAEAIAAAKVAAELAANIESANKKIAKAEDKIAEITPDVEASGSDVALGKIEEAIDAVASAKAAVEATEFDLVDEILSGIDDLVYEAKKAAKDATPKEEKPVDQPVVAPKEEEPVAPKEEEPVAPKEEEPVAPKEEEPVAPKEEEPVDPKEEEPVDPKEEEPVDPKEEEPVAPKEEEPVDQPVVAPKEEEPVEGNEAKTNEGENTMVDTTEEGGFPVVPVVIIVVVIVAVVAVAVIFKKKK